MELADAYIIYKSGEVVDATLTLNEAKERKKLYKADKIAFVINTRNKILSR